MLISVVIPAFNEEDYLGATLASLGRASARLRERAPAPAASGAAAPTEVAASVSAEIIVVDNDSTDATADVARKFGATVVRESQHNVARVRNAGAVVAGGDVLLFVDADTVVPDALLWRVAEVMTEPTCFGGAADTDYRPVKKQSVVRGQSPLVSVSRLERLRRNERGG